MIDSCSRKARWWSWKDYSAVYSAVTTQIFIIKQIRGQADSNTLLENYNHYKINVRPEPEPQLCHRVGKSHRSHPQPLHVEDGAGYLLTVLGG